MHPTRPTRRKAGFTLIELLVVILIILLVSAVTLPTVLPALQHQQVSEAARILQAELQRSRDLASRAGAPQGIRFLRDKAFTDSGRNVLCYSAFVSIETAPGYSEGLVSPVSAVPTYNGPNPTGLTVYGPTSNASGLLLNPTGWYWNIRLGDKIRFNHSGPSYYIVGPVVTLSAEGFINEGAPGSATSGPGGSEILELTNGVDDDNDGWTDEPYDGVEPGPGPGLPPGFPLTPTSVRPQPTNENEVALQAIPPYSTYVITRRPTVSPRARVISLPSDVVIDATGANLALPVLPERSRLGNLLPTLATAGGSTPQYFEFIDILFTPGGQVISNSPYAGVATLPTVPFYHFWLTERDGVADLPTTTSAQPFLPLPPGSAVPTGSMAPTTLKAERRLVTLFTRSGFVVVKQVEDLVNPNDTTDRDYPFRDAQAGIKDKL